MLMFQIPLMVRILKIYIKIVTNNNILDVCEEFESESVILDEKSNTLETLNVLYYYPRQNHWLTVNVTNFETVNSDIFYLIPFDDWYLGCGGGINDTGVCGHFLTKYPGMDFQLNIEYWIHNYTLSTIAGKLLFRNRIFLKEDFTPFTYQNPCWNQMSPIYNGSGIIGNNTFCCKKFTNKVTPTPDSGKCGIYRSTTKVLDNSAYLEVEYKLNSTILIVNIVNYFASSDSTVQLEAYNSVTFAQSCR